jgi:hypothetical protein
MASYVQSRSKDAGASTSSTLAYTNNVTAGNFKVAVVAKLITGSTLGCSDNLNGTWNQDIALSLANNDTIGIFSKPNATGGATTVTFTGTGGSGSLVVDILEFSGIVSSSELDQTGSASHAVSSATLNIATSSSTTQAVELIIAGSTLITSQTSTWGGGYTQDANGLSTGSVVGHLAAAYFFSTSTGVQTGAVTPGANTAMTGVIATFFTLAAAGHGNVDDDWLFGKQALELKRLKEWRASKAAEAEQARLEALRLQAYYEGLKEASRLEDDRHMAEARRIAKEAEFVKGRRLAHLRQQQKEAESRAKEAEARRTAYETEQKRLALEAQERERQERIRREEDEASEALIVLMSEWRRRH